MLTDTHCHLERFRQPKEVAARSLAAGVRVIAVTSRPSDFRMLFPLFGRRDGVRLAVGLHPLEVARVDLKRELELFAAYVPQTSWVGEIGLDFSRDGVASKELQLTALRQILSLSANDDRVLTIHSRGASDAVLDELEAASARRAILHWFSGPLRDLDRAVANGHWFSINPQMTTSSKGRRIIERIPRSRILLETDGPFAKVGRRPAEPTDVRSVLRHLATVWALSEEHAEASLVANFQSLCDGLRGVSER